MEDLIVALEQNPQARKATRFLSAKRVIKACRRHRFDRRNSRQEYVVTIGTPNYAERKFLKGHSLPNLIQLKFYPKKKRA